MVDQARAEAFHFVHGLRLQARKIIESEQRNQRDQQAQRGGDERLRHAAGDANRVHQTLAADQLKRVHHAADGAHQAEQWRGGDDGFQHPQTARQAGFDQLRLVGGARFGPPRRMAAVAQHHAEKAMEIAARIEPGELLFQAFPGETVGFHQREQLVRQPRIAPVQHGFFQHDAGGNDRQQRQRNHHHAAKFEGDPAFV